MNEQRSFERFVADHVAGHSQGISLPDDFYDQMHSFATTTRQRPEWLALIKEPPMRSNSRVAVGSPTVRVMAILAATLLLTVAMAAVGVGVQRLLAAQGTIIVAQDGSGDFTTINEAVAAAQDGDVIHVRPGTYVESTIVDKDVRISGDGLRQDVVVSGYKDPALWADQAQCETSLPGACALVLVDTEATIEGLTLHGNNAGLKLVGGAPTVTNITFDQVGGPDGSTGAGLALYIVDGSAGRVLDNDFVDSADIVIEGAANPLIEGNTMRGGGAVVANLAGDNAVVRDNVFSDGPGSAIKVNGASQMIIEGNEIDGASSDAISIGFMSADGFDPVIRGNTVSGSAGSGVYVGPQAAPTLERNVLTDNRVGVFLSVGDAVVRSNDIAGEGAGIFVNGGGTPLLEGNTVDVTGRGISVSGPSQATLTDNTVCGQEASLLVDDAANPKIDESNQICDAG